MDGLNNRISIYFILQLEFHGQDTEVLLSDRCGHWKLSERQKSDSIKALNFYV